MARDMILLEAPAAQEELIFLRAVKVGDTRQSPLFPALDSELEWTCTAATDSRWEWEVRFVNQLVFTAVMEIVASMLTLDVKEQA